MFLLPLHVAEIVADAVPAEERPVLATAADTASAATAALAAEGIAARWLATCHRLTLVWWGRADGHAWLARWLTDRGAPQAAHAIRTFGHERAARHLIELGAGLRSPLLGEPEILGQLRSAVARRVDGAPDELGPVLRRIVSASRRVREALHAVGGAAPLGDRVVSLLSRHAGEHWPVLDVLVVGSGQAAGDVLDAIAQGPRPRSIAVLGRNAARVAALATRAHGQPLGWEQLAAAVLRADAVVFAVRRPTPLDLPARCPVASRAGRPAPVWVDVGMPSVVPATALGPRVHRLDDVMRGGHADAAALAGARASLQRELARLDADLRRSALAARIADLERRAEAIAREELARLMAGGRHGGGAAEAGRRLARRLLHPALALLGAGDASEASEDGKGAPRKASPHPRTRNAASQGAMRRSRG